MRRSGVLLSTLTVVVLAFVTTLRAIPASRTTHVELDVVALNDQDRPVGGLKTQDFTVREDGRPVAIETFTEVSAAGINGRDDARSLVLLLDDMLIPTATTIVQGIAARFLNRARPYDAVNVVRLTHRDDELSTNTSVALERIEEYKGGALGYFGRSPVDDMLQTLTRISRSLESAPHRRTAVACIGPRSVCDPYLQIPQETLIWRSWRDAISAAAEAHASVYIVDVAGVESGVDLGAGLVEATGGEDFVRTNDFARAADLIWEQAGHYYLLGYTPTAKPSDLHTIKVSIGRRGVHALARTTRGD
jgi:VWFA-related protein